MNMNLKKWLDFVESDKDLSQELLLKKLDYEKDGKSFESFAEEVLIPEAAKHGFEISKEDIDSFTNLIGRQGLSMDELEDVAGGRSKVLMNVGVVSMALMSILPMATMFTQKSAEANTQVAIVDTVQNNSSSKKRVEQNKVDNSKSTQSVRQTTNEISTQKS